ncbi:sulfurtransferase [Paenibacillus sp. N3.4]|uniref:sulfurtransferase n=1 Tax=Paenibacillus sp. N3.4 TaxID=2603222 RepID=UPI0011C8B402|nr:rhodanese-like domain-containing protein [Paenibacillus sp. N3.4]TXK81879.1 sulfurtransferase [Paenibacillus sp. N3.4]
MTAAKKTEYPGAHLLVDVDWLETNRTSPDVVILDTRAKGYEAGHIPGASWFDVKAIKDNVSKSFVSEETFREILQHNGVSDGATIVVYDDGSGVLATRAFYVLEYFGKKDQVRLVNGGFTAWVGANKEISTETPIVRKGEVTVHADALLVMSKAEIQTEFPDRILLDVRSAEEYSGEDQRTNDKGGHIQGAIHKEWKDALAPVDEDGVVRFKDYATLREEFDAIGLQSGKTIVPYCQSNQRGAHSYFVLRLLGYTDIRPYEGSWDEWGNAEDTKVVRYIAKKIY